MKVTFNGEFAAVYGLPEAVIYQWLCAEALHYPDGVVPVYQERMYEVFPYFTEREVEKALVHLACDENFHLSTVEGMFKNKEAGNAHPSLFIELNMAGNNLVARVRIFPDRLEEAIKLLKFRREPNSGDPFFIYCKIEKLQQQRANRKVLNPANN